MLEQVLAGLLAFTYDHARPIHILQDQSSDHSPCLSRSSGRRSLRHVLFQAGLAAACHNPVLKPIAKRLKERGKPHKLIIIAIARRLVTIANAIIKTGKPWQPQPGK